MIKFKHCEKWFETSLIMGFLGMLQHYYHNKIVAVNNNPYPEELIGKKKLLGETDIKVIIMFAHKDSHYVFLHFDIEKKTITVTDGLKNDIKKWIGHAMSCLKKFCLVPETKRPSQVIEVKSCKKNRNTEKWNIVLKKTVVQYDNSSCGVIMCMEAWSVLSDNEVVSSGNVQKDRVKIINKYEKLTHISNLVCF